MKDMPNALTKAQTRKLLARALKVQWHTFVCEAVATMTAKNDRNGYTVRAAGDLWEICFMGRPQYAPMTASVAYGYFQRTTLLPLSQDADNLRTLAYQMAGAV